MSRKTGFLLLLVLIIHGSHAQSTKHIVSDQQIWLGYFNQTRFSNKWGTWTDLQLMTKEKFFTQLSQSTIRLGLTYYLYEATKLTVGYVWVNHFPADNHKEISQTEHRLWQQIQWYTQYKKMNTMQWIRLEERYRHKIQNDSTLANGYDFNYRVRYNFLLQVPLGNNGSKPGGLSFVTNDQLNINFGRQIINNYFDQNRFFLGF